MNREAEYLIENLGLLLSAGMSINRAIETIASQVRSNQLRARLEALRSEIESGVNLSAALGKTQLVPEHILSLIRVGEQSGRLPENLRTVALTLEKERFFRSRVRSAMLYPTLVFFLTILIGTAIAWFILPKLATVFDQLNLELPLITRGLLFVGRLLGRFGFIIVPLIFITLGGLIYFGLRSARVRAFFERLILKLPAIRELILDAELSRFGYLFGTLLGAGLPVAQALKSLAESTSVWDYRELFLHLWRRIDEGDSFERAFDYYRGVERLVPRTVIGMIAAAEHSGRLKETVIRIGEIYEEKSEISTKNLTVILEPILLVIVWLGVVGIAVAVILPLYSLLGGIGR